MKDATNLIRVVQFCQPDKIYNLAVQIPVQVSLMGLARDIVVFKDKIISVLSRFDRTQRKRMSSDTNCSLSGQPAEKLREGIFNADEWIKANEA